MTLPPEGLERLREESGSITALLLRLAIFALFLLVVAAVLEAVLLPGWLVWPTIITVLVVVAAIVIVQRFRRTYFG